jgi:vitamin B12/bleomycin/antimicrobial peptide transport system ATP-binding/permease protein
VNVGLEICAKHEYGRVLLNDATFRIARGSRVLVSGPSGSGKTTLFRAVSGLLDFGSGSIWVPDADRLFLPQQAYVPPGTLKRAVCYPRPADAFSDETVVAALQVAGLGRLAPRLGEAGVWERHLSGGEKQRLGLARVLVNRPRWLFLDEATSSLDGRAETEFYEIVLSRLPEATVISIAHGERLTRFLDYLLRLEDGRVQLVELTTMQDLALDRHRRPNAPDFD